MLVKLTTGLVMKKFKFGARPLAAWCCIADLFFILSFVAIALMNCPPLTMYGERGEDGIIQVKRNIQNCKIDLNLNTNVNFYW